MTTSLSERQRRGLLAGLVLAVVCYIGLGAKEFAASVLAARPNLASLQRAVSLSPGNADFRHRVGRYFAFVAGDSQSAIASYRAAVALDPFDAHYWFDLASAYQVTGDTPQQRLALGRALNAEPTAPDVAWQAANFFLVDGDVERALREFRVVLENDIALVGPSLQACWRVRPDAGVLLRDVIPSRADSLLAFLDLMVTKENTDGTIKTWDRLTQLHQKFEPRYLFDFVRYLIQVRRPEAAMAAWEQAAAPLGLSAYLPSEDNLVINGDFSLDMLNGGFDWLYVNRVGVRPLLDPGDFREGHRSLSLTFEGPGISDAGIQQLIPVRGATAYDFAAYYKSAEFEGAGGPQIVLRDAYSGAPLFVSEVLVDADFWKEIHSKITTPASTTLLSLAIERFPAGSPIRGKLWLDDFQLSPDTGPDDAAAENQEKP
jgi:hypothetical protein